MTILTIPPAAVRLLCGFTDTSQDAGLAALTALAQPALEYALDPAILAGADPAGPAADAGLGATLTLGVAEVIAGEYVAALGRGLTAQGLLAAQALNAAINGVAADDDGAAKFTAQTFRAGTLEISTRPLFDTFRPEVTKADLVKIGADLAGRGQARLAPYGRAARSLARAAAGGDANLDNQTPAPLLLRSGTPADPVFDAVLGRDGRTEPPAGGLLPPPFLGLVTGGGEL